MPNVDGLKGKLRVIKGRVKEALAEAAGDDKAADEGRVDQAAGEGRAAVGAIKERLGKSGQGKDVSARVNGAAAARERLRHKRGR
jgi:uncharacterized protein YjbJ (UPF0337 family)